MDLPSIAKQAERPYGNLTVFFTALLKAGLALLAIIPAERLPNYLPGDIPSDEPAETGARSS